jgi:translocation and assembly module TamB
MSRRKQLLLSLGGIVVILIATAILVLQSNWFRDYVRDQIVAVTEESTGGKVEIGSFDFDWRHLRATIRNGILHGTEPAGQDPLLRADLIQLDLKLFTGLYHLIDLEALQVVHPQANVLVYPDGRTNVPEPKVKSTSNTSAVQTIVDLKIGRFDLSNGSLAFNAQKTAFNAHGQNLRAQLFYTALKSGYQGQITMAPLYLASGGKAPVELNVTLPLTIQSDRITLTDARIATSSSNIVVNAFVDQLNAPTPHVNGHAHAHVALADAQLAVASGKGLPDAVDADVALDIAKNIVSISSAHVSLGDSNLVATGAGQGAVQFKTSLALGQLGRLFKVAAQPEGVVTADGNAQLTANNGYTVTAAIRGGDLGFRQGTQHFRTISIAGNLSADPDRIAVDGLKLAAFGGEVTGAADLEKMQQFHLDASLHGFDVRTLARTLAAQDLPYDGVISGSVQAHGDIKAPATKGIQAAARLAITPGRSSTPVSGRLNADYNGASDTVSVGDSYIALPNTRLDLSGSLDHQLNLKLVSTNLNDFQPVLKQPLPVKLNNGSVSFTGAVTGKLAAPQITGHLQAANFTVEDRPFDRFAADLSASSNNARIDNGSLSHAATQLQFSGSAGLHKWSPENYEPLNVNATIRNADVADLLAIAGQKDVPASGTLNANAQITGTIGNPRGNANLNLSNANLYDEHIDRAAANVDFADQLVRMTNTQIAAGTARIDMSATFQHPRDSFSTGTIQAHVASNTMPLDQFNAVRKQNQGLKGTVQLNADATANLNQVKGEAEFLLTAINANANAHGVQLEGRNLGDLTASAQTTGGHVDFNLNSDFAGSSIKVTGQTDLQREYPTKASVSIANLSIEQVLAVADRKDIPVKGNLSANAQLSGTLNNPQATVDLNLTKAVIEQEPLDRVQGRIAYDSRSIQLTNLEVAEGPSQVTVTGSFEHPAGDFEQGRLQFRVASNDVQLGKLHVVQQQKAGLSGTLRISADGAGSLRKLPTGSTELPVLLTALNADVGAKGLALDQKPLGDLTLKADTRGSDLVFSLDSDLGHSAIHGQGQTKLQGDYPLTAQLSFKNLTYSGLQPLLGSTDTGTSPAFDVQTEGQIDLSGPALKPEDLAGELRIGTFQLKNKAIQIQNDGPVVVALKNQVLNVQSGHLTGRDTDIKLIGSVAFKNKQPLNLQLSAKTNLKVLQDFDHDFYADGEVSTQLVVHGTFSDPLLNGDLRLQNASLNLISFSNGISNANGLIRFNGTSAVIQNLKGESGGGTVTVAGFVGYANSTLRYGLRANAERVRVRQQGASIVATAAITLNGTSDHSLLGGTVSVNKIAFNPSSDFGSLLSRSAPPSETPEPTSGPLAGMKLDIRIRTAPDVALQAAVAQNLQAEADLTLRGTISNPGMLGRITVTTGQLVFFGNKYDVNQGNISFFDPLKIDPILDVNLETKAQGVDVTITVTGPVNNMKLSYRSDPPLPFSDIAGLLAAGKTPTSDPNILANQPAAPSQDYTQMGESALVSQAIANPLSDRLSRVFGVTQVKIDPTFVTGQQLPQTRLTLQQQVAKNVTFTYISDVTQSNSQLISVEWDFSQEWSAVATRDFDGRFGVDFFYKRQFR